jgi:hypothetical protein
VYHNAATNVSVNDNDNDEFSEGVSDEHQAKENLKTKRKINFQEVALHLEMEERLMIESQADEDEDYMFLMSLLPPIKKTGRYSKIGTKSRISEQRNQQNSKF